MYVPFGLNPGYFMPQSSSLTKAELAIHELLGDVVYAGLEWKLRKSEARAASTAPRAATSAE
jgi:hypothetical protein